MSQGPVDTDGDIDTPIVEKKGGFSVIWLLPLLAAAIGGWLVYKSIVEAGIVISITFDSADGIEEGKTKIIYKGLIVGVVKTVKISEDLQDVTVLAEVKREAESGLRANTQFWLVRPKVSFTGITGLETLVSGNYIGVRPGDGEPTRHFKAVAKAPALDMSVPGLHIKLMADELGSIDRGSMVYYREIPVGEVQDYELSEDTRGVILSIHIGEQYAGLVKTNSRFWNASGVTVKAGLTGVSVRTESLASVIAGGIGFNTPESGVAAFSRNGDVFKLYADYDSAEVGITAKIRFQEAKGLEENTTKVKFDGFPVGVVRKLTFDEESKTVLAEVSFDPRYEKFLRDGSLFWFAEPRVSLAEFSRLGDILQGGYIGIQPGGGAPSREFVARDKAPPLTHDTPGLHLRLDAAELGAIGPGSPVLYKKIQVGRVEDYRLADDGRSVVIDIHVEDSYAHLVRRNTRFWNAGGFEIAAGLTDFKLRTGTLTSILAGGVEFVTPPETQRPAAKNGDRFILHDSHAAATENGRLLIAENAPGLHVTLKAKDLGSLAAGSKVFYQKIPVGSVAYYRLAGDRRGVDLHLHIEPAYADLVSRQSRFWNASGLAVEAGLAGVKVKSESVQAILNGGIAFFTPAVAGKPQPAVNGDVFTLYDDEEVAREDGVAIEIRFASGDGLSPGAAIKYQGLAVGKVREVRLADDLEGVVASAVLNGSGKSMAREGTRFWLVGPELGLTRTAHLDTLVSGRYLEIDPGSGPAASRFTGLMQAPLEYKALPGLNLVLESDRLGSVTRGNAIYYRQVPVGEVTGYRLADTADRVLIFANIKPEYAPLVREHSRFWNVSGVNVDFGVFRGLEIDTESLEALVGGGIAFSTPDAGKMGGPVRSGAVFKLYDAPEDQWLAWRPVIPLVR